MRGRKPKPSVLKDLHGSKEPRNPNEPIPNGDLSDNATDFCSDFFDEAQRAAWIYAIEHSPAGLLKRIDRGLLEVWVVAHCTHRRAAKLLQGKELILEAPGGTVLPSPFLSILNKQALIMIKAASELGFSPAARPRISVCGVAGSDLTDVPRVAPGDRPIRSLAEYIDAAPKRTVN